MWEKLLDALKQIFTLSQEAQSNRADIVKLQKQMEDVQARLDTLQSGMERLAYESP